AGQIDARAAAGAEASGAPRGADEGRAGARAEGLRIRTRRRAPAAVRRLADLGVAAVVGVGRADPPAGGAGAAVEGADAGGAAHVALDVGELRAVVAAPVAVGEVARRVDLAPVGGDPVAVAPPGLADGDAAHEAAVSPVGLIAPRHRPGELARGAAARPAPVGRIVEVDAEAVADLAAVAAAV